MCLKHRFYCIPQTQISGTKDTGAETRRAIQTRAAHRCNAVNKLGLTHRAHFGGAIRSIERTALGKDRLNNIMTAVSDVATNLLAKIHFLTKSHSTIATKVPQMVVGIDNRQIRLDDRLWLLFGDPIFDVCVFSYAHGFASKDRSPNLNTGPAENRKPELHSKYSCYDDSTGFERMMMLCYQRQYPNWCRIFRFLNRLRGRCFKPCLPLASLSCVAASTRFADRPSL